MDWHKVADYLKQFAQERTQEAERHTMTRVGESHRQMADLALMLSRAIRAGLK